MITPIRLLFSIFLILGLAGCQKEITYSYLLKHPEKIKPLLDQCQTHKTSQCDAVYLAANNIQTMFSEQQQNPEKFGQRILDTQAECLKAKMAYKESKALLAKMSNSTDPVQLQSQRQQVALAKKNYDSQKNMIALFYAVLAQETPE